MARHRVIVTIGLAALLAASFMAGFRVGESNTEIIPHSTEIGSTPLVRVVTLEPTPTANAEAAVPLPAKGVSTTPTLTPTDGPSPTPTPTADLTVHTVRAGDNLYRISQQYSVPVEFIVASNHLPDPSSIQIGQSIIIPLNGIIAPSSTPTPSPSIAPTITGEPIAQFEIAAVGEDGELGIVTLIRPTMLQGIPVDAFIVMPDAVRSNIRSIYARGQILGRNPHAFSKVGDSTIESPHFLDRFDTGPYVLGNFAYLQPVIDHYRGSFSRQGLAVRRGMHAWSLTDSLWTDPAYCLPDEGVVACELRVHNPSVVFFRMGSNDVGRPDKFEENMRAALELAIDQGIIPIIGTKADRHDGPDSPNNQILRRLAAEYQIPLWDFDLIAATIPGRGLGPDAVHMTSFYAHDWTSSVAFDRGHGVHSLTALMMLDAVMQTVDGTVTQATAETATESGG